MNGYQRAWRSVVRKPVKSVLLLCIVFVISVLLLSGMAGKTVSVEAQDKTRQALGAGFLLEANEANRRKRLEEISNKIGSESEGSLDGVHQEIINSIYGVQWRVWTDNSFESLRMEDIEKIASVRGIADFNITTAVTAVHPVNFERIEDADTDQSADVLGVSLIGNRDMTMDSNVLSGNLSVKVGRMITEADTGVCVISEELAEKNDLKVGAILEFNDYHDTENSTVYKAEIIGIYTVAQKMTPYMSGDTYRSENVIFTDLRFPEKAEGNENDPVYERAYFKVEAADQYDLVKEAVKQVDIDWERYDFIDNKGNLDIMSSNFYDLEKISQVLIGLVAGAGFVILFFVFVFWLKNRAKETGILLSLGISKTGILGQILLEALMITAFAVFLSFAAAPGVSKAVANYLAVQQVQQSEEQEALDADKIASEYIQSEQEVTGVTVTVTPLMLIWDGVSVMALISLSVIAAGTGILRKNPKEILSEMN